MRLPDSEWTALQVGLKPAVRLRMAPAVATRYATSLAQAGAQVVTRQAGSSDAILYVARTLAAAQAIHDAETPTLPGPGHAAGNDVRRAAHATVGTLLGYPACCVAAFVARTASLDDPAAPRVHEDFLHARATLAATVGPPRARLNNLLWTSRRHLVTWYLCRYDCAASLRYADRLHAALASKAPEPAAALDRALACTVTLAADGTRSVGAPTQAPPGALCITFHGA